MSEVNRVVDESRLEPLPVVTQPEVVLRAEGLTKTYPAVSGRAGSGDVRVVSWAGPGGAGG